MAVQPQLFGSSWRLRAIEKELRQSPDYNRDFFDDRLAALYDVFYPPEQRADFAFYFPMIMNARSVLDAGCGTGALLRMAREAGHGGRLCGLDPAGGMLNQARARSDIEWVQGTPAAAGWDREFDLVVMTGHAFQELVEDEEIRATLTAIRSALTDDGRFAFETRNALLRGWEQWATQYSDEVTGAGGVSFRCETAPWTEIAPGIVRGIGTYTSPSWDQPLVSSGVMRFVDAPTLSAFLREAGLAIEMQFGEFHGQPLTDTSPEIVTIARKGQADSPS